MNAYIRCDASFDIKVSEMVNALDNSVLEKDRSWCFMLLPAEINKMAEIRILIPEQTTLNETYTQTIAKIRLYRFKMHSGKICDYLRL